MSDLAERRKLVRELLIEQRITNDGPSMVLAYALWVAAGGFGGHRIYLRHWRSAAALAACTLVSLIMAGTDIGVMLTFVSVFWVIGDVFFIPMMARARRDEMRKEMMANG